MNWMLLYLLLLFSGLSFRSDNTNVKKWVIIKGCSLKVDGKTNINNFSCAITNYSRPDTIVATTGSLHAVQLNGNIKLEVQHFDCHNPVMTADLRKTLKAREFPRLVIRFLSISQYPDATTRQKMTKGLVTIELAGVSKRFEVDYKVLSAESDYINLVGSREINFSDFNISPPSKLGGMIRTDNELSVVFNLRMKVLD